MNRLVAGTARDRARTVLADRIASLPGEALRLVQAVLVAGLLAGCATSSPTATPPISAGTPAHPREVNIIASDYAFEPPELDVVPGETVLLHVINGGVETHEVVIGDMAVQSAWEAAEATTVGAPPGPTPRVSVAPGLEGIRIVVLSGQRVDHLWTVPSDADTSVVAGGPGVVADASGVTSGASSASSAGVSGVTSGALVIGCHIPGHWAKGMQIPVRFVLPHGDATTPPS